MKNLFNFKNGKMVFTGKHPVTFIDNNVLGTNEYRARSRDFEITLIENNTIENGLYKLRACAGSGFRCFLEVKGRKARISEISCYSPEMEDHYSGVVKNLKEGKYLFVFGRPVRYSKNARKKKNFNLLSKTLKNLKKPMMNIQK